MNTIQRIAKNTIVLFIANIISKIISFFYVMYTARYLGAEGFGILSFALAFTAIFGVFTDLGLSPLTVREVARDKSLAGKYLGNITVIKIFLVIITFGLIAITINLLGYSRQTVKVVYFIALSVIFGAFTGIFYSIFQAFEKMEYQSLGQILNSALMLLGVVVAIKKDFGVIGIASLYFIVKIIILGYNIIILKWKFTNSVSASTNKILEVDWNFWKSTIKEALPFGLAITFVMIFYWIDSVMLSLMKGNTVVGWYNAAYRMVLFLLFIPNSFISAIYPIMSKFYITSQDHLRLSLEKSFKYLTILGVPIGVGTTLLAKKFILMIFGLEYTNSIIALQILVWSSVFIFMSQPFANLLNCLNKQSIVTKITGICVVLNVTLNLILIPKYSLIGASIATVLTEFGSLVLCFIWSLKIDYSIFSKKVAITISKVVVASTIMGIFVMYFINLSLFVLLPLAVLLYFVVLYVINGIDKEEFLFIGRVIQKRVA